MKKNFLLFVAITSFVAYSQDKSSKDYNVFSVEANVGINKPGENFSPGYFTADPKVYFNFNRVNHFNLGFRYMLNEKFGLKLDGAYDIISPEKGNGSLDFESKQIRVGLQGVVNLRNLLNFDSWTKKFGLLAHAGIQVSLFEPVSKTMPWGAKKEFKDLNEDNGGFIFGLTPQFKLHRRIVLTGDVTFIHNTRHHLTWDGEYSGDLSTTNLKSSMVNTSLGITYYFGKQDEHADFYIAEEVAKTSPDIENLKKKLEDLNKKVDNIKIPTVPSIDEINTMIDGKIKSIPAPARIEDTETINQINEGFINVYFDFNRYTPHPSSTENISRVINFLKNNPEKSMELTGWTDIIGSAAANAKLSERRAETVRQVLIKQGGIDPNRLKVVAKGVDNSASKDNEFGRAMVRRVTFTIVN